MWGGHFMPYLVFASSYLVATPFVLKALPEDELPSEDHEAVNLNDRSDPQVSNWALLKNRVTTPLIS